MSVSTPIAARLTYGMARISCVVLFGLSAATYAQESDLAIQLPNPDGPDPVFDESSAGQPIEIEFLDLATSEHVTLDDSSGRLRVINFWATWCAPCIRELPSLALLAEQRADAALDVIPISLDQDGAPGVPAFVAELDIDGLRWYVDPTAESGQAAGVFVLPTTVIVDAENRELGRIIGSADWASAEAALLIDALLAE